jgi:DNA-binding MarR family transcriptional regulator
VNERQIQEMATGLHGASIRLLRLLRREDREAGVSGPRLSALSVIVFAGPLSLTELAAAEQVKPPTMSRIVEALVRSGLAWREPDPVNRRMIRISATAEGAKLLEAGRARRVRALVQRLHRLADSEQRALARAVELLERAMR